MSVNLTPVQRERALYIENEKIPCERWRICIPEVFIAERETDRFLKLARPDAQEYPIIVHWEKSERQVSYVWTNEGVGPIALEYKVCASAEDDFVNLQFSVKNIGQTKWSKRFSAAVCLRNREAPRFIDPNGKRSTVFPKTDRSTWGRRIRQYLSKNFRLIRTIVM